jgi:hypothetical protein
MFSGRRGLLLVAAVAACAALPSAAHADGDPASDFLITQQVFFGFGQNASASKQAELARLVQNAKAKGFEVRVALIGRPSDLGAVQVLWRRPQTYARFLGQELTLYYPRRLLIVMPNGYGIYRRDRGLAGEEQSALSGLPAPGSNLVAAAELAVQRLAALHGVTVEPTGGSGGPNQNRERLEIVAIVLAVLVALAIAKGIQVLAAYSPRCRAMTIRCTSFVPSPISRIFWSR